MRATALHEWIIIAAMVNPSLKTCFTQEFTRFSRILVSLEGYKISTLENKNVTKNKRTLKNNFYIYEPNKGFCPQNDRCIHKMSPDWFHLRVHCTHTTLSACLSLDPFRSLFVCFFIFLSLSVFLFAFVACCVDPICRSAWLNVLVNGSPAVCPTKVTLQNYVVATRVVRDMDRLLTLYLCLTTAIIMCANA